MISLPDRVAWSIEQFTTAASLLAAFSTEFTACAGSLMATAYLSWPISSSLTIATVTIHPAI
jgi:hypothetical protein